VVQVTSSMANEASFLLHFTIHNLGTGVHTDALVTYIKKINVLAVSTNTDMVMQNKVR